MAMLGSLLRGLIQGGEGALTDVAFTAPTPGEVPIPFWSVCLIGRADDAFTPLAMVADRDPFGGHVPRARPVAAAAVGGAMHVLMQTEHGGLEPAWLGLLAPEPEPRDVADLQHARLAAAGSWVRPGNADDAFTTLPPSSLDPIIFLMPIAVPPPRPIPTPWLRETTLQLIDGSTWSSDNAPDVAPRVGIARGAGPDAETVVALWWRDAQTLELVELLDGGVGEVRQVTGRGDYSPSLVREALRTVAGE